MKILCIGDSNTYGYDPRSFLGSRYPKDVRWTDNLYGHDVINCGVNGMAVPDDGAPFVAMIEKELPDVIIIMLGGNDLLLGRSADDTRDHMASFLDSIIQDAAGAPLTKQSDVGKHGFNPSGRAERILLIAPPSFKTGEWVQSEAEIEESQRMCELYLNLASEKGCMFADADEWDIAISFDGVHFLPEGHMTFASKVAQFLNNVNFMVRN